MNYCYHHPPLSFGLPLCHCSVFYIHFLLDGIIILLCFDPPMPMMVQVGYQHAEVLYTKCGSRKGGKGINSITYRSIP